MKKYGPLIAVGTVMLGTHLSFSKWVQNHDAAFNMMMWHIWENPDRDTTVHFNRDPIIKECQRYLYEESFWHQVFHKPPFDARKRFKNVSVDKYNKHCLSIAEKRFAILMEQLRREKENKKD